LDIIAKGGYVILVIFACSFVACAVIIERWLYYRALERAAREIMPYVRRLAARQGGAAPPASLAGENLFIAMWQAAGRAKNRRREEITAVVEETVRAAIPQLERYLYILVTIATIAPLLGLLGTVFGMIKTFHVASLSGVGNPHMLAEGISEALYNTAGGLMVTIPCVVANNHYRSRVEKLLHLAESYGGEMARLAADRGEQGAV